MGLHLVWGCFHHTVADLSSCNRDHMAHKAKNIYCLALYRKSLPLFALMNNEFLQLWINMKKTKQLSRKIGKGFVCQCLSKTQKQLTIFKWRLRLRGKMKGMNEVWWDIQRPAKAGSHHHHSWWRAHRGKIVLLELSENSSGGCWTAQRKL